MGLKVKNKKKKEKSVFNKVFIITILIILSVYAVSIIFPLVWGLITSFKNPYDIFFNDNILGFPTLDSSNPANSRDYLLNLFNYQIIIRDYHLVEENARSEYWYNGEIISRQATGGILGVLFNTVIYTVIGAFLHSIVPALVAYAVSKFDFKFNGLIIGLALFAMIMPIVGTQSSMLAMLRQIGLYDTIWGYLLQKFSFTGMYFFVFCAFYKSLSNSFSEAAEIDGASQLRILLSIIIPLSSKMLASVFLVQFVGFWNDYQTAFLYMPSHPTLAYTIWFLTNNNQVGGGEMVVRVAGAMTLAIPILIVFIFLKNKLMGNITMGGLKQ